MNSWIARISLLLVAACGGEEGGSTVDAAGGGEDAPPAVDAAIDAPAGPPNAQIAGTWDLMTPSSTCNVSFGAGFIAAATAGSDYNFTLTLRDNSPSPPMLTCALSISSPGTFTCSNFSQAGMIPPTCNVALALSGINGTVAGDAVEIQASVQVTSPNCGQALNCGPLPHVANGTIE